LGLLTVLRSIPELPGAACRGLAWDDLPDTAAARICLRCPALSACARWADAQPANSLHGIIAGRRYSYVSHPSVRRHADGAPVAL
jgi:hypothetical protein